MCDGKAQVCKRSGLICTKICISDTCPICIMLKCCSPTFLSLTTHVVTLLANIQLFAMANPNA